MLVIYARKNHMRTELDYKIFHAVCERKCLELHDSDSDDGWPIYKYTITGFIDSTWYLRRNQVNL